MENNKLTFEQILTQLQDISKKLNDPNIALDDAINLYKKGVELSNECKAILESAKEQINIEK